MGGGEPPSNNLAVSKGHSGGIIDTRGDLLEEAKNQLAELRGKETAALIDLQMPKQPLEEKRKDQQSATFAPLSDAFPRCKVGRLHHLRCARPN